MKWLFVCLAVFFMVAPAMAGEDAYIAIVGNDNTANPFYFSPKYQQFLYDQTVFAVPVCFTKPGVPRVLAKYLMLRRRRFSRNFAI